MGLGQSFLSERHLKTVVLCYRMFLMLLWQAVRGGVLAKRMVGGSGEALAQWLVEKEVFAIWNPRDRFLRYLTDAGKGGHGLVI